MCFCSIIILPSPENLQHLLKTSVINISVNYKKMCELWWSWVQVGQPQECRAWHQPIHTVVSSSVHWLAATAQNPWEIQGWGSPVCSTTCHVHNFTPAARSSCVSLCKSVPFRRRLSMNWARQAPSDVNRKWQQAYVQLKKMCSEEVPVPYSSAHPGAQGLGNANVIMLHEHNQSATEISAAFCQLS